MILRETSMTSMTQNDLEEQRTDCISLFLSTANCDISPFECITADGTIKFLVSVSVKDNVSHPRLWLVRRRAWYRIGARLDVIIRQHKDSPLPKEPELGLPKGILLEFLEP